MPLPRTPPEKGNAPKRPHTFGPYQAFPDGTPLPPTLDTPSIPYPSSQSDPTPTRVSSKPTMLIPPPGLQPLAEGDTLEEMEIDGGLHADAEEEPGEKGMDIDEPASLASKPSQSDAPHASSEPKPSSRAPRSSTRPTSRPSSSQTQPQPDVAPTTPRRRSRRVTVNPETDSPETLRPPPNAFSTPKPSEIEHQPSPSRLTRATTPAGTTREQLLAAPAVPIDDGDETRYGRYYEALVRPLRIQTLGQGIGRLKLDDMAQCYPLIAAETPDGLRSAWESMLEQVRGEAMDGAYSLFEEYRMRHKLQRFADTVDDGLRWNEEHPGESRPDAWRPDLTPQVLSTACNLGVYDESWRMLREEYLSLTKECGERLKRVHAKRDQLASLDNGVSDAVLELGKTNALFEGFPSTAMLEWAEDVGAE
ncbi:hypothetical protein CC85DRAFT_287310 [Cutaneotrichosporon oleaginosum]|uniref:Uncharacterized protein n=1 Tax=Cutaneotrichosporon oleaginosum TaxID=879819 RepID=A0A0J1AZ27_9TREE|nr:uncharacterized protein CC85DRAFT_287310 [Cutaneotrichosporon oleaginosum]KLT40584.1 hypothetical protein CC85DRAFT_287310 [Cutaneotrichosporon oleaginosum]TXT03910.1 hypothetical protein COLE_07607 [Cutaneotrichosporon oleaginosum]